MERAWELFWKLDQRDKFVHMASPVEWVENKDHWIKTWLEYKNKIPGFMRPFMFMNPFSFYMEYCYRMVSESNETLRMPLVPPESEVLFDGCTKSEQTESRPIRRAIENSSRESSLDGGDAPEPDFVPFGPHSPDGSS